MTYLHLNNKNMFIVNISDYCAHLHETKTLKSKFPLNVPAHIVRSVWSVNMGGVRW